uniref:NADH-ubiquinone oxidoreductase chain 4L n=1 Tax=Bregmaceros nectabanus TaxID=181412 RepID=Q8HM95_BRENE|nr:NADH dehydrogenase subunit 4L [Bregmaceros nectabanus]
MSSIHFILTTSFLAGLSGLALHRTHLISVLLCLETMMLTLFIALSLWSLEMETSSYASAPLLMLAFSACEAGTGLALLVATTRTHGTDHLMNMNLLKC